MVSDKMAVAYNHSLSNTRKNGPQARAGRGSKQYYWHLAVAAGAFVSPVPVSVFLPVLVALQSWLLPFSLAPFAVPLPFAPVLLWEPLSLPPFVVPAFPVALPLEPEPEPPLPLAAIADVAMPIESAVTARIFNI